jgi:hypothetical protein
MRQHGLLYCDFQPTNVGDSIKPGRDPWEPLEIDKRLTVAPEVGAIDALHCRDTTETLHMKVIEFDEQFVSNQIVESSCA